MRLLHTKNLIMKEFIERLQPPYAILSHTWGDHEVSFQDFQENNPFAAQGPGWDKIRSCCQVAAADGFEYVWIDTCCIDKTSSSELSEAINSMYHWYQGSAVCYAYLADVNSVEDSNLTILESAFKKSRWFTRGWTLQELIAPSSIIFLTDDWMEIGTKNSLHSFISSQTGISPEILLGGDIRRTSVAHRMSWASKRQTTRIEDKAYCLMGIFDVNMPMLYGEGERAFIRLQEEIMKHYDDFSIFAWQSDMSLVSSGLLATDPSYFIYSRSIVSLRNESSQPFSMTNQGISIWVGLYQVPSNDETIPNNYFFARLDCQDTSKPECDILIVLKKAGSMLHEYVRDDGSQLLVTRLNHLEVKYLGGQKIYVRQRQQRLEKDQWPLLYLKEVNLKAQGIFLADFYPKDLMLLNVIAFQASTDTYSALRYVVRQGMELDLVILVKNNGKDRHFKVLEIKPGDKLDDITKNPPESLQNAETAKLWNPDHAFLPLRSRGWIRVGIRKQLTAGNVRLVLEVKWCPSQLVSAIESKEDATTYNQFGW